MTVFVSSKATHLDIVSATVSADRAVLLVDQAGSIVLVNAHAERLFGYTSVDLLGRPIEVLVPDRFRGKHSGFRNGFFVHATARRMGMGRIYGRRHDGVEFGVEITLHPVQSEEGFFVLTVIEATDGERERLRACKCNATIVQA